MKLTNPTDDELNAAFAEKVAGWELHTNGWWYKPEDWEMRDDGVRGINPRFTRSMDAVLPWVDKWRDRPYLYRLMQLDATCDGWLVKMAQPDKERSGEWHWNAEDPSLPRACVIALLRAHGVEVVFT